MINIPPKVKNLTGQRFGKLTVTQFIQTSKSGTLWQCLCDCGKITIVYRNNLYRNHTTSCGCKKYKHGYYNHPLYSIWNKIEQRCNNPKHIRFKYYGGANIFLCQKWTQSPKKFIKWALANGWQQGLEIDRINNNKGYHPNNCRFVTSLINNKNRKLLQSNNTTGFRGVKKSNKKYIALQTVNGKRFYLGMFSNPVSAAMNRDWFAMQISNELPLNFPILQKKIM